MTTASPTTDEPGTGTAAAWTTRAGGRGRAPVPAAPAPVWPELVADDLGGGAASGRPTPPSPAPPPSYSEEEVAALCAAAAAEAATAAEARLAGELGREADLAQAKLAEGVVTLAAVVAARQEWLRADAVGIGAALGRVLAHGAIARDPTAAAAAVADELIAELRDEPDVVVEVAAVLVDELRARLDKAATGPSPDRLVEVRAAHGLRGGEVRVVWRDGWAERLLRDVEARAAEVLNGFNDVDGTAGRAVVVENGEIAEVSA